MTDSTHCQNHPEYEATVRCVRYNRRFCEVDFADPASPPECLSAGTYCEYRSQCVLWAKVRELKRRRAATAEAPAPSPTPATSLDRS